MKPSSWGRPGRAGQSAGGGVAGVRDGDHQIGLDRRLAPQDLAHPGAGDLQHGPAHLGVGPGEVDVLEHADGVALGAGHEPGLDPVLGQGHDLPGHHVAQEARADEIERARLAGHAVGRLAAVGILDHAQGQRPQAMGIAEGDDRVVGDHDGREGALQPGQHVGHGVLDALGGMRGQQGGDDLRVRRRAERHVAAAQLGVQLDRVDQVAVVGQGERAAVIAHDRLGVLPLRGAGGRVAHVADGHLAHERAQRVLVKDLGDEPLVANRHDVAAARGGGDARRLLSAVL